MPAVQFWGALAWNGSTFSAVAQDSSLAATSPDCATWTMQTMPSAQSWIVDVWNGSAFVAVGSGTNIAALSPDGVTWAQVTLPATEAWWSLAVRP
jgi:hypothetical protein